MIMTIAKKTATRILPKIVDTVLRILCRFAPLSDIELPEENSSITPGGHFNFRTGRQDAGLDPNGIYDED